MLRGGRTHRNPIDLDELDGELSTDKNLSCQASRRRRTPWPRGGSSRGAATSPSAPPPPPQTPPPRGGGAPPRGPSNLPDPPPGHASNLPRPALRHEASGLTAATSSSQGPA